MAVSGFWVCSVPMTVSAARAFPPSLLPAAWELRTIATPPITDVMKALSDPVRWTILTQMAATAAIDCTTLERALGDGIDDLVSYQGACARSSNRGTQGRPLLLLHPAAGHTRHGAPQRERGTRRRRRRNAPSSRGRVRPGCNCGARPVSCVPFCDRNTSPRGRWRVTSSPRQRAVPTPASTRRAVRCPRHNLRANRLPCPNFGYQTVDTVRYQCNASSSGDVADLLEPSSVGAIPATRRRQTPCARPAAHGWERVHRPGDELARNAGPG
jgi:hypothetical protein